MNNHFVSDHKLIVANVVIRNCESEMKNDLDIIEEDDVPERPINEAGMRNSVRAVLIQYMEFSMGNSSN